MAQSTFQSDIFQIILNDSRFEYIVKEPQSLQSSLETVFDVIDVCTMIKLQKVQVSGS